MNGYAMDRDARIEAECESERDRDNEPLPKDELYGAAVVTDDDVVSELAERVQARLHEAHRNCDVAMCPLRRLWPEDVQEILDVIQEESVADPTGRLR